MLTSPQFHAGMAERANRSIKERLYRYFTERGTYKWIEVVQDIVKGINYSLNSSIGMRPADVTRQIHSEFVYHENYNSTPNGKLDSLLLYILILGLRLVLLNNNLSKLNGKQEIRLLGEGSEPLAKRVRTAQNSFAHATNSARRGAREEYIKRKTREKRSIRDEEKLLEALLTDIETMVDLFGVTQGLLAREKRAETSKIPLRMSADDNESYQHKLDEYFSNLSGPDLDVLEEMIRAKLNEEIKNMVEEDRTILDATKEMGMEAWVQAYRATDKWVAIEDTDVKVSTIQGIGQTFVQQLKVTVGNTEVYDSGNLYPFKAYITNELSFPVNAKKNFLGSTGYYHTERHNDETDDGFKERCKVFKGGNSAQFLSRLDFDLGNQELYLLNNLDLLFTIYKAKDAFLLQTLKANDDTKYRLTVHDVKIYAKMIEVQPSLNMNLYKTLEKQPATYAVHSTIPRRVTIALVSNSAFNGDYKLTPFKFDPFDLREISVHAGGMVYPVVPHKLNFSKNYYVRAFVEMYEALGMANSERSFDVSMDQFKNGWAFFVIPLNSTLDDSCGFELLRSGTTSIRATFDSPIPKGGVEMIVLGEFDQMIMIDYNRHIVSDSKLGKKEKCHQVKTLTVPFNHPAMFSLFNSRINNRMQTPSCKLKLKMQRRILLLNWWREDPTIIRFLFGNRRAPAIEAALLQRAEHEAEIFRQYAENQQQQ
ncbi:hypothetical protein niasHT_038409 [Heterodera trifolii]|uniref:Integrase catalytic domain-containing protein n=1 Tax=Heterodera trifolii TaxID=157864 RepID=A0ABD2IKZ0_9BILA